MKEFTKITYKNVKERCQRKNANANNKLHWFSSKFSIYLSYLLIRIGVSADQATTLFFLIGLAGSLLYISVLPFLTFLGYILWRLHVLVDMCDGDIARFNSSFSIRGAYWDAVIHAVLNPLYYILICFSFYLQFDNNLFILIGALLGLSSSVLMAVKNNYFKAMLFNDINLNKKGSASNFKKNTTLENIKFKLIYFLSEILSIEGFVFLTVFVRIMNLELYAFILVSIYLISNLLISFIKFYQLSYKGKTFTKS